MQLYALDGSRKPILAEEAIREKAYLCPECLRPVRVRGGPHRQIHFYHIKKQSLCREQGKSLEHLQLQLFLKKLFPAIVLERPFPEIGRIADAHLEEEQIIFEIQCSAMSLEEARGRCNDYTRRGMTLVWILHDKRFNQKNLSPSELFLRTQGACYFSNMNKKGEGLIYDQYDKVRGLRRLVKGIPLAVSLHKKIPIKTALPPALTSRKNWQIHFQGDLIDRLQSASPNEMRGIELLEKPHILKNKLSSWHSFLFNYLLEKA